MMFETLRWFLVAFAAIAIYDGLRSLAVSRWQRWQQRRRERAAIKRFEAHLAQSTDLCAMCARPLRLHRAGVIPPIGVVAICGEQPATVTARPAQGLN